MEAKCIFVLKYFSDAREMNVSLPNSGCEKLPALACLMVLSP